LWQGRFGAVAMDEARLAAAVGYVSLNPVGARLVARASAWRWSRVPAHLAGENDALVRVAPVLERYGRFADFLGKGRDDEAPWRRLRMSETSGRPIGSDAWLEELEAKTGRTLKPRKRGPKPKRAQCI
jgi:putative transposase